MRESLDLSVTPFGHLLISADPETIEKIREMREDEANDDDVLWELTERYWTNGSFQPFDAGAGNPFVGLTEAPCVAESITYLADGEKVIDGRFWYWPAYMTKSFVDEILEHGSVVFTLA